MVIKGQWSHIGLGQLLGGPKVSVEASPDTRIGSICTDKDICRENTVIRAANKHPILVLFNVAHALPCDNVIG
jgi:hypothetical protein